jgi:N-acetylglucosamine-6-phosphate deacetylase
MFAPELVLSGNIWHEDGFKPGRVTVREGRIAGISYGETAGSGDFDFGAAYITPGLIDLQLNGGLGLDFTVQPETVNIVAAALPRWGVTSFLPTFITAPIETYHHALGFLRDRQPQPGALVLGAHLEGPYLNEAFRGAHDPQFIREPSLGELHHLLAYGTLKFLTLAPEEPGSLELIHAAIENKVLVATGHSGATYEQGLAAFEAGAACATHLFNAMPPLHHRKPGLVGAVLDSPTATANLIVDGIHLHPAIVRLVYRLKGWQRVVLLTDAMAGLGMPPGRYDLAGQAVIVDEKSARLVSSGSLAGSILTLNDALKNMVEFTGCAPHEAVGMATLNPARLLGLADHKGRLEAGFDADIAVFGDNFEPLLTIVGGEVVFRKS